MADPTDIDVDDPGPTTVEVSTDHVLIEVLDTPPATVEVVQTTSPTIEVTQTTGDIVEIHTPGPQGPPGPIGPHGLAGRVIVHQQTAPAATWIITHDLDRWPAITTYDSDGTRILPDEHVTTTSCTLIFATPTTGTAVLT